LILSETWGIISRRKKLGKDDLIEISITVINRNKKQAEKDYEGMRVSVDHGK